jgi:apolipoprotein N-acyltransferase
MHAFGHMPTRNEVTHIEGFEFKVINADQRKIHSLRLRPPPAGNERRGQRSQRSAAWQVLLLAPLAGASITLSLAPFNIWPSASLGCAVLAYLLAPARPRQALWRGWLFGLGLFGSGASWVYVSIHVYGNAGVPLAVLAYPDVLRLAWRSCTRCSPGCTCAWCARSRAACCWVLRPCGLGEWLRSWLLTGFPWLYLGYAHVDTWLSGWAPITGVYGLSFAVAFTASCVFLAWRSRQTALLVSYGGLLATLCGRRTDAQAYRVGGTGQRGAAARGPVSAEHPAGKKMGPTQLPRHSRPVRARPAADLLPGPGALARIRHSPCL